MSMDLTGEDAFEKVLDAAIEARVDLRVARMDADSAKVAARAAEKIVSDQGDVIVRMQREKALALPKLSALWIAADRLRVATVSSLTAGPADVTGPLDELSKALNESAEVCDQTPF